MNRKALAGRAAQLLARAGILSVLEAAERDPNKLRVVAYHRIDELDAEPDLDPGLVSATPREFSAQLEMITKHYAPISLGDVLAARRGDRALPPRSILLTFDDGYRDFERNAWPILERMGIPAVLFVPTAYPDRPGPGFWWDRLHAALRRTTLPEIEVAPLGKLPLADDAERRAAHRVIRQHVKSLPHTEAMPWLETVLGRLAEIPSVHRVLGWDALRNLAGRGLSVCSHSHEHALCTRLTPAALSADLERAGSTLANELSDRAFPSVLAYPASANDETTRRIVRETGHVLAFGGRRGINDLSHEDPMNLMRLPMHRYSTPLFRAQLRPSVARLGRLLIDART